MGNCLLCFDEGQIKPPSVGCGGVMINIWLSFQMYSEKTWPSCGHRSTSLGPPPCQSHFTSCSTSVTRKHTNACTYKWTHRGTFSQIPTRTECPSSPCSEMNEFAAVLNHFNHFNGKCLIHSYHFTLPCSYLMYTHFKLALNTTLHTHTHNDCHSLIVLCNRALQNPSYSLSLSPVITRCLMTLLALYNYHW